MERFIRPVIGLKNKIVLEEDRRQVTPLLHLQEYLFCLIWTEGPLDDGSQSLHLTILCVFLGNCPASAAPSHLMAHVVACFCDWINCLICLESAHLMKQILKCTDIFWHTSFQYFCNLFYTTKPFVDTSSKAPKLLDNSSPAPFPEY
ncbi:uncharacterized protein LOC104887265 isoform X2 [Beta vulgaris subsp. vulgaris]|uniref:uncharacterized protein LOC104887265 isoform X2 n=1 Tax=Beta vulgaris subsp. vulgaris TaxID=3555 RepID=UPI00053F49D6|nr:uncharacterized protein LOC104887265 isoform X2 [Beta vulgaris subsp. vulgaris]